MAIPQKEGPGNTMYFTALPDHTKPGFDEQLHFNRFKKHNIIFNAAASKSHCERHVGCLSLKTVQSGEEWYGINNRRLAVRPGQFLVLNDDQPYSCHINHEEKVRVLSVFFKKEFASAVFYDAMHDEETLLDNPFGMEEKLPEFFQTLNDISPQLQQQLKHVTASAEGNGGDGFVMDEHLLFLLRCLIKQYQSDVRRSNGVYALKTSTKTEIYRRLCIARDMLHTYYTEKPNLRAVSAAACISVPQLTRQFKAVIKITPHQYLVRIRLRHAAMLLKTTGKPVHEITWLCGFENTSAFCRAFKAEYGVQAAGFRASC